MIGITTPSATGEALRRESKAPRWALFGFGDSSGEEEEGSFTFMMEPFRFEILFFKK